VKNWYFAGKGSLACRSRSRLGLVAAEQFSTGYWKLPIENCLIYQAPAQTDRLWRTKSSESEKRIEVRRSGNRTWAQRKIDVAQKSRIGP